MNLSPWNWSNPLDIILGGSKRFAEPLLDPTQSWEISGGTPAFPVLTVKSRSENRVESITQQIKYNEGSLNTPSISAFPLPFTLDHMGWDWIEFHCQPLSDLDVEVINWVPDPRVICGRHLVNNLASHPREIILELSCQGEKSKRGIRFSSDSFEGRKILSGSSNDQNSILFITGGEINPIGPSNQLLTKVLVEPGRKTELRWILAYCDSNTDGRTYLDEVINLEWDGEIALRKISLSSQLQIKTGNLARDFSLAYSQRQAQLILNQLFLKAEWGDPDILTLDPRQIWQLLLAVEPMNLSDLNQLLTIVFQETLHEGPHFPLIAEIFWRALQAGLDPEKNKVLFSGVTENLQSWFFPNNDKDGDGIPEEIGENYFFLEHSPLSEESSRIKPGQDEVRLESPGLAALLQNELSQLGNLSESIPGVSIPPEFRDHICSLEDYLLASWQESESRFQTRDHQTHLSKEGFSLPKPIKNGWNILRIDLPYPSRLSLHIPRTSNSIPPEDLLISLQGVDWQNNYRIEELSIRDIVWNDSGGLGNTKSIYSRLDHCIVLGLDKSQDIEIKAPKSDRLDLSLTLTLWSEGLPANFREKMISNSLAESTTFWSDYGYKSSPMPGNSPIHLPLNLLVNRGLIKAGQLNLASMIFHCWWDAATLNILNNGCLYSTWESKTGSGIGKANQLESTLPVGILLDLLGVRFRESGELILEERNPLIFPVQMNFRGTELTLKERETILCRPGGDQTLLPRGEEIVIRL